MFRKSNKYILKIFTTTTIKYNESKKYTPTFNCYFSHQNSSRHFSEIQSILTRVLARSTRYKRTRTFQRPCCLPTTPPLHFQAPKTFRLLSHSVAKYTYANARNPKRIRNRIVFSCILIELLP